MMHKFRKHTRSFAIVALISFIAEILAPLRSFAVTGYDSMPEYRSFEPVATTNMVNMFDGSLTYNIPLLDVPNGYPINLSYHSNDINTEALASWVGLGWNLNPGAINRVKRGFPDDFAGESVTYHSRIPANWTISGAAGGNLEILSKEDLIKLGGGAEIRYNNYTGIGYSIKASVGYGSVASLDFSYAQGKFGFQPNINPAEIFSKLSKLKKKKDREAAEKMPEDTPEQVEKKDKALSSFAKSEKRLDKIAKILGSAPLSKSPVNFSIAGISSQSSLGSLFSSALRTPPTSFSTTNTPYGGLMVHIKFAAGINFLPFPIDPEGYVEGRYTRQKQNESTTRNVFGYMHNEKAVDNEPDMMDFFTENDSPFEKRDNILGIPLPNNDIYNLSGEGMGGSFRPYRSEFGHYRQNRTYSDDVSVNVSGDVNIAAIQPLPLPPPVFAANLNYSFGAEAGVDYHFLEVGEWEKTGGNSGSFIFRDDDVSGGINENWFFRFSGDMGGSFDLTGNDDAYRVGLTKKILTAETDFSGAGSPFANDRATTTRRSSYVSYNNVNDAATPSTIGTKTYKYKAYEKNLYIKDGDNSSVTEYYGSGNYNAYYNNTALGNPDGIEELVTHNADGVNYVYGLPVYARNEKQLSYSLKAGSFDANDLNTDGGGLIAQVSANIDGSAKRKSGFESATPYATTYLLTQINSPDYLDREMDGPTPDDFGSYTKFNYSRYAGGPGSGNSWYSYRSPFKGVNFGYGSLSDKNDDMGSFSYGEKEIYFIQSIASKTHVAIFTLSERQDGQGAKVGRTSSADKLIIGEDGSVTPKSLKKLDKIELYAIGDVQEYRTTTLLVDADQPLGSGQTHTGIYKPKANAVPIKTVHFEYNYSLCPGIPNNSVSGDGKLTLSKVWFEYEGKLTSKISPYVFEYKYPTPSSAIPVTYPSVYSSFQSEYAQLVAAPAVSHSSEVPDPQNPAYNVLNTDRWGNYRNYFGVKSNLNPLNNLDQDLARFWPFVNQNEDTEYDPAAYCLKRIILPSGGEIHIQYEQNDYMYVQDKRASVMVPLSAETDISETVAGCSEKRYYLSLDKIGLNFTGLADDSKRKEVLRDLFAPLIKNKERLYFNFLYSLIGDNAADYTTKNSEYIEGYARIASYGFDYDSANSTYRPYFTFTNDNNSTTFGEEINYDSKVSKREMPRKVCDDFYNNNRRGKINNTSNSLDPDNGEESGKTGKELVLAFAGLVRSAYALRTCNTFKPEMSYVRLQMPAEKQKKKGGGVRVKRLLMYDGGINSSDPNSLYGQEYSYTTKDELGGTISSGVATNEPSEGRRENSLVVIIERDSQRWYQAILYGRDMYSQEGPLGESLMPGASIGYSKVTVSSIHKGNTSTGTEEHEFYTCKDFPFIAKNTPIHEVFKTKLGAGVNIGAVSANFSMENPYIAQGYSFISNSMHGQPKRIAKYAAGLSSTPMAEELYEYYKPGDQIGMMDENLHVSYVNFSNFGKESEVLSERRKVADVTMGVEAGFDFTFGVEQTVTPPPVPVPVYIPGKVSVGFSVNEKILHTHVTTKIINYPAIVSKVTTKADGITNITENLVLDKFTGNPVVTKSYDDFTGTYLNHDYMAAWSHNNMRTKAINERLKSLNVPFVKVSETEGYLDYSGGDCSDMAKFVKGDLLELKSTGTGLYHVDLVDLSTKHVNLLRSGMAASINSANVDVLVLRSGYTNQLNVKQGNILTHGENIVPISVSSKSAAQNVVDLLNSRLYSGMFTPGFTGISPEDSICVNGNQLLTIVITFSLGASTDYNPSTVSCASNIFMWNTQLVGPGYGFFGLNGSGKIVHYTSTCAAAHDFPCDPELCPDPLLVKNVVSASATTFSDLWDYTNALYPQQGSFQADLYENGKAGKWRAKEQFVYRENINQSAAPNPQSLPYKNFNEAKFDMFMFDWKKDAYGNTVSQEPQWVNTSTTTGYTPNGEPLEDRNILGIFSTAKYGYNNTLPVIVAQNAEDHTVAYESFENIYSSSGSTVFEDNVSLTTTAGTRITTKGHTGTCSILLDPGDQFLVAKVKDNNQPLIVRGWFNAGKNNLNLSGALNVYYGSGSPVTMQKISAAGEWVLYEAQIPNPGSGSSPSTVYISSGIANVYMDDVRVQPKESEVVCYVYDRAQRLTAVLDDQHYAMIYQYNSEGILVRKLKETVEGVKTISETQYNSKGLPRP